MEKIKNILIKIICKIQEWKGEEQPSDLVDLGFWTVVRRLVFAVPMRICVLVILYVGSFLFGYELAWKWWYFIFSIVMILAIFALFVYERYVWILLSTIIMMGIFENLLWKFLLLPVSFLICFVAYLFYNGESKEEKAGKIFKDFQKLFFQPWNNSWVDSPLSRKWLIDYEAWSFFVFLLIAGVAIAGVKFQFWHMFFIAIGFLTLQLSFFCNTEWKIWERLIKIPKKAREEFGKFLVVISGLSSITGVVLSLMAYFNVSSVLIMLLVIVIYVGVCRQFQIDAFWALRCFWKRLDLGGKIMAINAVVFVIMIIMACITNMLSLFFLAGILFVVGLYLYHKYCPEDKGWSLGLLMLLEFGGWLLVMMGIVMINEDHPYYGLATLGLILILSLLIEWRYFGRRFGIPFIKRHKILFSSIIGFPGVILGLIMLVRIVFNVSVPVYYVFSSVMLMIGVVSLKSIKKDSLEWELTVWGIFVAMVLGMFVRDMLTPGSIVMIVVNGLLMLIVEWFVLKRRFWWKLNKSLFWIKVLSPIVILIIILALYPVLKYKLKTRAVIHTESQDVTNTELKMESVPVSTSEPEPEPVKDPVWQQKSETEWQVTCYSLDQKPKTGRRDSLGYLIIGVVGNDSELVYTVTVNPKDYMDDKGRVWQVYPEYCKWKGNNQATKLRHVLMPDGIVLPKKGDADPVELPIVEVVPLDKVIDNYRLYKVKVDF